MFVYVYRHTGAYRRKRWPQPIARHYSAFILLSVSVLSGDYCLFVCLFVVFRTLCHPSLCVQSYQWTSTHTHPPHTQCQLRVVTMATNWMIFTLFLPVFEWLFTAFYCLVVFSVHRVLLVHFQEKSEHVNISRQVSREDECSTDGERCDVTFRLQLFFFPVTSLPFVKVSLFLMWVCSATVRPQQG